MSSGIKIGPEYTILYLPLLDVAWWLSTDILSTSYIRTTVVLLAPGWKDAVSNWFYKNELLTTEKTMVKPRQKRACLIAEGRGDFSPFCASLTA